MVSALTVLFSEPSETYPIPDAFPLMEVIMTEVLLVVSAVAMVRSILLPSASFSSMPKSSMKAPRVPEPSSRETTVILSSVFPQPANNTATIKSDSSAPSVCLIVFFMGNRSPFFQ